MATSFRTRTLNGILISLGLALLASGAAQARVGVTSATSGDPLGKPPQEVERVLRIGIDVQANELITTSALDRAHLLFLDGTSLTVGPNAQLTIDRFVFDPATGTGDLAINAGKGVLRLVGGKISKNNAIRIDTPSATIGVRGGIALFAIDGSRTTSTFLFGRDMTVTGSGQTQTVKRAGFQVVSIAGQPPGPPLRAPGGGLDMALDQLEGATTPAASGEADAKAEGSGFSRENSGQSPGLEGAAGRKGGALTEAAQAANALSNANSAFQQELGLQRVLEQGDSAVPARPTQILVLGPSTVQVAPPVVTPPVVTPPVVTPPVVTPPVVTPVVTPPVVTPVVTPPVVTPPVVTPVVTPPVVTPVVTPPVVTPVVTPPVVTPIVPPPVVTPPVVTPPVVPPPSGPIGGGALGVGKGGLILPTLPSGSVPPGKAPPLVQTLPGTGAGGQR